MPALAEIVGQARAIDALRRALDAKRLAGAYLFAGPEGVGKATTALGLARALACDDAAPERCAPCRACDRIERDLHPDVLWLRPDGAFIKVEQVRAAQVRLGLPPHEAARRLVVIDPADRMNPPAQNALLKSLEEPPPRTHFVLCSAAPHRLLPTVLSRCQRLVFAPLHAADVERALGARGVAAGEARAAAARVCDGSVGRALALLEGDALARRLSAADAIEQAAASRSAPAVFDAARRMGGDREDAQAVLELLRTRCRDRAAAATTPAERRAEVRCAQAATEAIEDVIANVNLALAVERMALRFP